MSDDRNLYVAQREFSELGNLQHMVDNHAYEAGPNDGYDRAKLQEAWILHSKIDHAKEADHDHRA